MYNMHTLHMLRVVMPQWTESQRHTVIIIIVCVCVCVCNSFLPIYNVLLKTKVAMHKHNAIFSCH